MILRIVFVSEKGVWLLQSVHRPVTRRESARACLVLACRAWSASQGGPQAGLSFQPLSTWTSALNGCLVRMTDGRVNG